MKTIWIAVRGCFADSKDVAAIFRGICNGDYKSLGNAVVVSWLRQFDHRDYGQTQLEKIRETKFKLAKSFCKRIILRKIWNETAAWKHWCYR